jgi:hypothetical protein
MFFLYVLCSVVMVYGWSGDSLLIIIQPWIGLVEQGIFIVIPRNKIKQAEVELCQALFKLVLVKPVC